MSLKQTIPFGAQRVKRPNEALRALVCTAIVVSALASASTAIAQQGPPPPEQQAKKAVEVRQGLFNVQGFIFGPVGAMLKGAQPVDAALVRKAAARLEMTSSLIPEVFQVDTHTFQVKTEAKETIWTKKSDFDKKANDLQAAASALEAAAKTRDNTAILAAAGKVGNACKACHDDYRQKL